VFLFGAVLASVKMTIGYARNAPVLFMHKYSYTHRYGQA